MMVAYLEQMCYTMSMNEDGLLTFEQASERFKRDIEVLNDFYAHSFSEDAYMPVVRDNGIEDKLNAFQFILNFIHGNPYIAPMDKGMMSMWVTQAAFWLGYLEGRKPEVNVPDVFLKGNEWEV